MREFPELLQRCCGARPSRWSPSSAGRRGPAGSGWLAACDVVVAASSATFAFSEVRLGLVPAVISAVVPAADGAARGAPADADRRGVRRRDRRRRRAGRPRRPGRRASTRRSPAQLTALAAGAPAALAETKRLLRARTAALDFDALLELSARFFAGEEGQEGIASFREKRPARWVPAAG